MLNYKDSYSVITLGSTKVSSIHVILMAGNASTAVFIGLLAHDEEIMTAVHIICPKSTRPLVKYGTAVKEGVFGVRLVCEPCPFGYYFGERSVMFGMHNRDHKNGICKNKVLFHDPKQDIYTFCSSPEGKCSLSIWCRLFFGRRSCGISQFLGLCWTNWIDNHDEMSQWLLLSKQPSSNIKSCSDNRAGIFCGRCKPGFTEAVFSSHCIQDSNCNNWFIGVYVGWVVLGFCLMYCFQHLFNLTRNFLGSAEKTKRGKWFAQMINWDSRKLIPSNSDFLAFFVKVI